MIFVILMSCNLFGAVFFVSGKSVLKMDVFYNATDQASGFICDTQSQIASEFDVFLLLLAFLSYLGFPCCRFYCLSLFLRVAAISGLLKETSESLGIGPVSYTHL